MHMGRSFTEIGSDLSAYLMALLPWLLLGSIVAVFALAAPKVLAMSKAERVQWMHNLTKVMTLSAKRVRSHLTIGLALSIATWGIQLMSAKHTFRHPVGFVDLALAVCWLVFATGAATFFSLSILYWFKATAKVFATYPTTTK